ncbi:MAG: Zn-dependent hydrolase [Gracilimonas sp.]|uniref:dipeptidyl-peptidase 3 family protein n=1 Tax=Gracilimonas sp. TaxID=1974203 RepID=UPI0019CA6FEA|nr:Zn-dependent hydrolase [Gracilimonas sp.]MBD3616423.1 Zn-dependent hydrolase [Gracilimonas sp.]
MKRIKPLLSVFLMIVLLYACTSENETSMSIDDRLSQYTSFTLKADLSDLSENQKKMIPLLIDAAKEMEKVFWLQAYGNKAELLTQLSLKQQRFAEINYGPWDRLNGNEPFIQGVGEKPAGANFYPADITKEEFEAWDSEDKNSLYTLVRRAEDGSLLTIPYSTAFAEEHQNAAAKLNEAAELAEDPGFKKYLELRAAALLNDEYQESDLAWMDMKNNSIELVIGPIETYEDQLFGYKAAHEAFVLIKDKEWSDRLSKYAEVLPELQRGLPVPEEYKSETPGTDSDLNAYDAVYYAGDANAGSKTIAINLPNDEQVQLEKGTRRLQLKNSMRAKYDKILVPISEVLIAEDQQQYISFDAFFGNTMFHEVAHGLGVKNTITGKGTVREALQNHASALEEGKADVLGLYMVNSLREKDMIEDGSQQEDYVTFLASIFRSIRFGSSSAHGRANLIRFNYFRELGAFSYDPATETYRINFDKVGEAVDALSEEILTLQGNGDYEAVDAFVKKYAVQTDQLKASLDKLSEQNIPVDITFEQGVDVLGL